MRLARIAISRRALELGVGRSAVARWLGASRRALYPPHRQVARWLYGLEPLPPWLETIQEPVPSDAEVVRLVVEQPDAVEVVVMGSSAATAAPAPGPVAQGSARVPEPAPLATPPPPVVALPQRYVEEVTGLEWRDSAGLRAYRDAAYWTTVVHRLWRHGDLPAFFTTEPRVERLRIRWLVGRSGSLGLAGSPLDEAPEAVEPDTYVGSLPLLGEAWRDDGGPWYRTSTGHIQPLIVAVHPRWGVPACRTRILEDPAARAALRDQLDLMPDWCDRSLLTCEET